MSILNKFKKQQPQVLKISKQIPSGLIAQTDQGYFYIKGQKKFKFVSDNAMRSWNLPVIKTTSDILNKYVSAGILGYRDGTLVKDISDGRIYLISDSKRRLIVEPEVFEWLPGDIKEVGRKEISIHTQGDVLE